MARQQAPTPQRGRATPAQSRPRRLGTLLGAAMASLLTTACEPWWIGNASPSTIESDGRHRWKRTRLLGVNPGHQIGWLDNERILFIGSSKDQGSGLFVWDRRSPARLILPDAFRFCYDGRIWTVLAQERIPGHQNLPGDRYELNPADLTTKKLGSAKSRSPRSHDSLYTCQWEQRPRLLDERDWVGLRPADGYLDLGPETAGPHQARIIRADGTAGIPVDLQTGRTRTSIEYSRHAHGYQIHPHIFSDDILASWQASGSLTIWNLDPTGRIMPVVLTDGPWTQGGGGDRLIEPIRGGHAISSSAAAYAWNSTAGIYAIHADRSYSRVETGSIQNLASSPDGCRLAYQRSFRNRLSQLRTIDLCIPAKEPP